MKDFIFTLLQTILSAAIPVIAAYLVSFLKKKSAQAMAQTENAKARQYIGEVTEAVTTAVTATSQTYVDALKAKNEFTAEAQLEALNKAKATALAILSPAATEFITDLYGDVNVYIEAKIEETVKMQKQNGPAITGIGILDIPTE